MSLKGQNIRVKAEKIVFPGRSLCRCEDGLVLFTQELLPGETAEVFVTKDKKSFREGLVKRIIEKSYERIEPICPSFGKCGGCAFQHISYQNQIKYKQRYLNELFAWAKTEILPVCQSPKILHYRNKMEFSFFERDDEIDLGLHHKGCFDKYISIPPCFIADESFLQTAEIIKNFAKQSKLPAYNNKMHQGFFRHLVLRKSQNNKDNSQFTIYNPQLKGKDNLQEIMENRDPRFHGGDNDPRPDDLRYNANRHLSLRGEFTTESGQMLINIVVNSNGANLREIFKPLINELQKIDSVRSLFLTDNSKKSDAVLCDNLDLLFGEERILERLNVGGKDYFFKISPFSFFQTNSAGAEILYNETLNLLNPNPSGILLDLYCGSGAIGLSLSQSVKEVMGIEIIQQSVLDAEDNAKLNGISNAHFTNASAQDWAKSNNGKCFDYIIVDPPRSGLTKEVIAFLLSSHAERIIYISCEPSTLSRDLSIIAENGKYKIVDILPIDMFPHTYHIETIVRLDKRRHSCASGNPF